MGLASWITFTGFRRDLPRLFEALEVVCVPSRNEAFGLTVIEAMAAGKVVVGQVGQEVPRVVEETFGTPLPIVDVNDDTLEDVLRDLAADRERRQQLAADSASYVRKVHDVDLVAKMLDREFLAK